MRQQALQQQIEGRVKAAVEDYHVARQALMSLQGEGNWSRSLKELKPEDVRGINERLLKEEEKATYHESQKLAGVSEKKIRDLLSGNNKNIVTIKESPNLLSKRQPPSWIWYIGVVGDPDNAKAIKSSLRVEWCKAHTHADHSQEELKLLEEEMHRAIAFCYWRAQWWISQRECCKGISRHLAEGLVAYANEQAEIKMDHAVAWSVTWLPLCQRLSAILETLEGRQDLDLMLQQLTTLTVELDPDEDKIQKPNLDEN
ncbi:hypothetical protein Moror_14452 [Moniliophthora roreri MCA 2997]|uniref:Uncharacterized protein n=2 Tax=Moniliophthora roreri TaxID=221103 RepID=V2WKT8_MONRO|nr:hypothetical protein Moror_14452 [Moniliophthora roreri MCA 2997]